MHNTYYSKMLLIIVYSILWLMVSSDAELNAYPQLL